MTWKFEKTIASLGDWCTWGWRGSPGMFLRRCDLNLCGLTKATFINPSLIALSVVDKEHFSKYLIVPKKTMHSH